MSGVCIEADFVLYMILQLPLHLGFGIRVGDQQQRLAQILFFFHAPPLCKLQHPGHIPRVRQKLRFLLGELAAAFIR